MDQSGYMNQGRYTNQGGFINQQPGNMQSNTMDPGGSFSADSAAQYPRQSGSFYPGQPKAIPMSSGLGMSGRPPAGAFQARSNSSVA